MPARDPPANSTPAPLDPLNDSDPTQSGSGTQWNLSDVHAARDTIVDSTVNRQHGGL